jgi:predicted nucleic acid-binding protein
MILADTSVWIDHLRKGDAELGRLLNAAQVLTHPFVIGEIALGHLRQRALVLGSLMDLPRAKAADDEEAMAFIEVHSLFGLGIGFLDAHLLAAVKFTPGASLWTRDKRLAAAAGKLGLAKPA